MCDGPGRLQPNMEQLSELDPVLGSASAGDPLLLWTQMLPATKSRGLDPRRFDSSGERGRRRPRATELLVSHPADSLRS